MADDKPRSQIGGVRVTAQGKRLFERVRAAGKPVDLKAVRPSAAIRADYQARLDKLVDDMNASIVYWISARYRANPPAALAMDASPAEELRRAVRRLSRRWQRRFAELGPKLAAYFAQDVANRVDADLKKALKDAGFTVDFKLTRAQNDALAATVNENVALIKSIGQQHFTQVEGYVMRAVQAGSDLGTLAKELEAGYGITKRRAQNIARSQNFMANSTMVKVRQRELGITKAKWLHSAGGKTPRPEHVAFSGKLYDVEKGAFLEGKWTWPGREPNCRCVSISVIPGLEDR
jgi:uncharacterized protein with gpF-like domain